MPRTTVGVATLALVLAACSSGTKQPEAASTGGNANAAAAVAAAEVKLQPGEYESTTKVLEFSVAGMPQNEAAIMEKAMSGAAAAPVRYCLTAAEAAEGPKEMVSHMSESGCNMVSFNSVSNGVSGSMQCSFPGGTSANTSFSGTYASDGSNMTMTSDVAMAGGRKIHRKVQVDSHRVGECSG